MIFNGVFGSNLYGLATPKSDIDYKGVYLPSNKSLILQTAKETIETHTDEMDTTLFSIGKFVKNLAKSDTVSMDMLHTPTKFTLESTPLWGELRSYRSDLYCKNMRGTLEYIGAQTSKYGDGDKVGQYNEIKQLLDLLRTEPCDTLLKDIPSITGFKYIKYYPQAGVIKANIDVCGSFYQMTTRVGYLRHALVVKLNRYGSRTIASSVSGVDWKSMSHAYRVLLQLEEIIDTRDLIFPLTYADTIMQVKLGQLSQKTVMGTLTDKYDQITEKLEASDLPENLNMQRIEDAVLENLE